MTSSIDDRQKAFENKFKLDEEQRFKANIKAVRLLGLLVAEKLGLTGEYAEKYAEEVVDSDFDEPGIQDVLRKVQKDLTAKGIEMTDHHLENEYSTLLQKVMKEMAGA